MMKKQYSKPGIIIEDFKLAQHIANCGVPHSSQWGTPLTTSPTSCAWQDSYGDKVFVMNSEYCTNFQYKDENGKFGQYCYNNPAGLQAVFGS